MSEDSNNTKLAAISGLLQIQNQTITENQKNNTMLLPSENAKPKRNQKFFKTIHKFLLLFKETVHISTTPKRYSTTIMEADYVTPECKICKWGVIDSTSCITCKCPLHLNCGFRVQEDDTIGVICNECGEGKKRLVCETLRDSQLSLQWLPCKRAKGEPIEESALLEMKEQKLELFYEDFFSWLATLDEILYEKKDEAISFFGRNKVVKRVRKIDIILLQDVLFEFFPAVWKKFIQGKEGEWFLLPPKVKLFIHSHGRCFANTQLSSKFIECHYTDWTYLKFTSETNAPSFICDTLHDFDNLS